MSKSKFRAERRRDEEENLSRRERQQQQRREEERKIDRALRNGNFRDLEIDYDNSYEVDRHFS